MVTFLNAQTLFKLAISMQLKLLVEIGFIPSDALELQHSL